MRVRVHPRRKRLRQGLAVIAAIAIHALLVPSVQARELGAIGPVHPISEPDMLDEITTILHEKQASGELARIEAEGRRQVQARIARPTPVEGLRRVQVPRRWLFDPSVRFDEPVLDGAGRVVVPGGTVFNPLDAVAMTATWLLFDGRDPGQVAVARAEIARNTGPLRLILVAGAPLELSRAWDRPVYFDQAGRTVKRLGLSSVPARVSQQGRLLLVEELVPQ